MAYLFVLASLELYPLSLSLFCRFCSSYWSACLLACFCIHSQITKQKVYCIISNTQSDREFGKHRMQKNEYWSKARTHLNGMKWIQKRPTNCFHFVVAAQLLSAIAKIVCRSILEKSARIKNFPEKLAEKRVIIENFMHIIHTHRKER